MLLRSSTPQLKFILLVALAFISSNFLVLPLHAGEDTRITPLNHQPAEKETFSQHQGTILKQGRGRAPGRRRGGGRRDDCPKVAVPLTAIIPQSEDTTQNPPVAYVGATTAAEHPTFWFYVPYTLNPDLTAEFILQDQAGTAIYKLSLAEQPEPTPGIISIPLPATVPLEVGQGYEWYFKVNCGAEIPIYTNGGIERVPLDSSLFQQLATTSPQEQVRLYQENDLWYDAITTLGNLRRSNPNDAAIAADWNRLLQVLGIEDILQSPSNP